MSNTLELIKASAPKTREEARAFLKRCGLLKTTRILEGEERKQVETMLRLIGPGEESNSQRFWTEEWVVGDKTYQHTTGKGIDELSEITDDEI
jgi:hypothetical protein